MLAIRMQRTGRKRLASFRVVVQDSRFAPNSGRVVAKLGHHNPHTKETVIDKEKAEQFLSNGAQPSERVARLFSNEKIKMPDWVVVSDNTKKGKIKNPDKLRKNRPAEEKAPEPETKVPEAPAEETPAEAVAPEAEAPEEAAPVAEEEKPEASSEEPAEAEKEA